MNQRQFDALRALMEEYARNVSDEIAGRRIGQINHSGTEYFLCLVGRDQPGRLCTIIAFRRPRF